MLGQNQPKNLPIKKWISKLQCTSIVDYSITVKMNVQDLHYNNMDKNSILNNQKVSFTKIHMRQFKLTHRISQG